MLLRAMSAPRVLRILVLAAIAGCAPRTELVVGLASSLPPAEVDQLRVIVRDSAGVQLLAQDWPLAGAGAVKLPGSFGVVSASGDPHVHLAVEGLLAGQVRVSRLASLDFVPGKTLFLRMALDERCYDQSSNACPEGAWCAGGVCVPIAIPGSSLPEYAPGDESVAQCGGGAALGLTPSSASCAGADVCIDDECIGPSLGASDFGPLAALDGGAPDEVTTLMDASGPLADTAAPPSDAEVTTTDAFPDLTLSIDGAAPDLPMTAGSPDLAMPDLGTLSASPDLVTHGDLASPHDLAVGPDLLPPQITFAGVSPGGPLRNGGITAIAVDPSSANLTGSPVWAVTAQGSVLHLDKSGAIVFESPPFAPLALDAVYLHGGDVWIAGSDRPVVLHRAANGAWTSIALPAQLGASGVIALGNGGASASALVLGKSDDGAPTPMVLSVDASFAHVTIPVAWTDANSQPLAFSSLSDTCGMFADEKGNVFSRAGAGAHLWTQLGGLPTHFGAAVVYGCGAQGTFLGDEDGKLFRLDASGWKDLALDVADGAPLLSLAVASAQSVWGVDANNTIWQYAGGGWATVDPFASLGNNEVGATAIAVGSDDAGRVTVVSGDANSDIAVLAPGASSWTVAITPPPVQLPTRFAGHPWSDGHYLFWPAVNNAGTTEVWYTDDTTSNDPTRFQRIGITVAGSASSLAPVGLAGVARSGKTPIVYLALDGRYVLRCDDLTKGFATVEVDTGDALLHASSVWAGDTSHVFVAATWDHSVFFQNNTPTILTNAASGTSYAQEAVPLVSGDLGGDVVTVNGVDIDHVFASGGRITSSGSSYFDSYLAERVKGVWQPAVPAGGFSSNTPTLLLWVDASADAFIASALDMAVTSGGGFLPIATPQGPFNDLAGPAINDLFIGGNGALKHWDGAQLRTMSTVCDASGGLWVDKKSVWCSTGSLLRASR